MLPVARLGDTCTGVCFAHGIPTPATGIIITADFNSSLDRPIARMGDVVRTTCGHTGIIVTGSFETVIDGVPVARIGDQTFGEFVSTIITASETTMVE